jgi:hypothetical protein
MLGGNIALVIANPGIVCWPGGENLCYPRKDIAKERNLGGLVVSPAVHYYPMNIEAPA